MKPQARVAISAQPAGVRSGMSKEVAARSKPGPP
jgi:hypothetical protein